MNKKTPDHPSSEETDALRRMLLAVLPTLGMGSAFAQDAVKTQPGSYRIALENDKLRVLDHRSRPGLGVCGVGMHSHPAHLTVVLTAGKVRVKQPDGKESIGENQPGHVFWSEAETHEVENISGKDMRALLIELKAPATRKA